MTRAVVLLAIAALLAVASTGCGGDDADEPETSTAVAWADELCSAGTTWIDELERIGDDFTDVSSLSGESLRQAASDVGTATDAFLEDIRALGAPESGSGDEAQRLLEDLSDTLESEKDEVEDAIDDASGFTGIASAVSTAAGSLATMWREFRRTFDELRELDASGELETAFEDAEACDRFMSS